MPRKNKIVLTFSILFLIGIAFYLSLFISTKISQASPEEGCPACLCAFCGTTRVSPCLSYCGDDTCTTPDECIAVCRADCSFSDCCGDGICEALMGETVDNCPHDCPVVKLYEDRNYGGNFQAFTKDEATGVCLNVTPQLAGKISSVEVADEYLAILYEESDCEGKWTQVVASQKGDPWEINDLSRVGGKYSSTDNAKNFNDKIKSLRIEALPGVVRPPVILYNAKKYDRSCDKKECSYIQVAKTIEDLDDCYFDNKLSSVRIAPGWRVTLCTDKKCEGGSWFQLISTDSPDLNKNGAGRDAGTFNDNINALRLEYTGEDKAPVTLYDDADYPEKGGWIQLGVDSPDLRKNRFGYHPIGRTDNAYLSSIEVSPGYLVTLFNELDYSDKSKWFQLVKSSKKLKGNGEGDGFNDDVLSLKIKKNSKFPPALVTLYQDVKDCANRTPQEHYEYEPKNDWTQLIQTSNLDDNKFNNMAKAVEVAPGWRATLYDLYEKKKSNGSGAQETCYNPAESSTTKCCILQEGLQGKVSYVKVEKITECGNGIVEDGEDCDCGPDKICQDAEWGQYNSCGAAKLGTGTWSCCLPGSTDCTPCRYDARGCSGAAQNCGNGKIDTGEVCDHNNTPDDPSDDVFPEDQDTCGEVKPGTVGTLKCVDCTTINSDGCQLPTCNNDGICQPTETTSNCPEDCYCGNGTCDSDEDENSCPADCGAAVGRACYPPDCCQLTVETVADIVDFLEEAASDAINDWGCRGHWRCSTILDPDSNYTNEKDCKKACRGGGGTCFCPDEYKYADQFKKEQAPGGVCALIDIGTILSEGRGIACCEKTGTTTLGIKYCKQCTYWCALWETIMRPKLIAEIHRNTVIGTKDCATCVSRFGEVGVTLKPNITMPTWLPWIGGETIDFGDNICATLINQGWAERVGLWGQIWVNLNPFVKAETLEELIGNIVNFLLLIGLPLAFLFFIIGGIMFMTAAGNPDRVNLAKRIILYAAIGLVIVIFAKGLVELIKKIIG